MAAEGGAGAWTSTLGASVHEGLGGGRRKWFKDRDWASVARAGERGLRPGAEARGGQALCLGPRPATGALSRPHLAV